MSDTNEQWVEVATVDELSPGKMKRVEIDGHRYLITNAEGQIYAVDDQCSHEDVSLYLGCIQGKNIKCSLHGSRFSLETGEPLEAPADEPIGTYETRVKIKKVLIKTHKFP
ncbi:MAG: non-heme iron oxygenase ferredoxin subunit [Candidatus Thiodiazotropha sp. (ex Myrtea spinifera)]|nr:non-heme iron oxygenase ferredoxin subunit [Candidatus Thiodiazotropha sp. (ex Myrtea spinifera)]MCU7829478.1 non-heme iron oxygenase ferredoxin subunit [Candidatus Thiodiazotropha sp. (ex Myrtea sp. 'scaly one' KF741663)]